MTKEVDTGEKIYTEAERQGIIKDAQGEREKRHEAEFQLDQSKRQLETLTKTVEEMKAKSLEPTKLASEDMKFDGKDEDYATVKDVKSGFKSLEKTAMETFKKAQNVAKEVAKQEADKERFDESCQKANEKYARLESIGLDFKTVYRAATRLVGRNKYEEQALIHAANPGEAIYKRGCEDPAIKAKLDLEENQELLNNMESRKVDKTSLSGGIKVKTDEFYTPQEVIAMTPQEAKDNLPKIEKSMKHWEELKKQK